MRYMKKEKLEAMIHAWGDAPSGTLEMLREFYREELLHEGEYFDRPDTIEDIIEKTKEKRNQEYDAKMEENILLANYYTRYPHMIPDQYKHDYHFCVRCGKFEKNNKILSDPKLEMLRTYYEKNGDTEGLI